MQVQPIENRLARNRTCRSPSDFCTDRQHLRCDPVSIFDVRVLGLDVAKHLVISLRCDQFWSLVIVKKGCILGCRTYTGVGKLKVWFDRVFPSTEAFQKNLWEWVEVGTSATKKYGWTRNHNDYGNITLGPSTIVRRTAGLFGMQQPVLMIVS